MNQCGDFHERSFGERKELTQPGFSDRAIARAIDFIIVAALCGIIPKAGYLAGLVYLLIADGLFHGRSIGKKLAGLRVVRSDTAGAVTECGFKESVYRNSPFAAGYILYGILGAIPLLGWLFSLAVIAVILGFECLVMLGSDVGMRLGDEIAKTRVVEDKNGGLNVS